MKKLKVGILTVICTLVMVMPVMAASSAEGYCGQFVTSIKGRLIGSTDNYNGRGIVKSLNMLTTTDRAVSKIIMKYEIQGKDGKKANVYNNSGSYESKNTNRYQVNWGCNLTGNGNGVKDPYKAYVTHEMRNDAFSYAVYTSTGF